MDSQKIEHSLKLVRDSVAIAKRPAAMLSFGKDSMAMAHLIRGEASVFPMDVIYHRDPWFAHKHEFADSIIRSWNLNVFDFPPYAAGVKAKPDMIELVARYNFGLSFMDIPKNTSPPSEYPRREFICGLNDWLLRPKGTIQTPWDTVFIGHRNADVDPFDGPVPLKADEAHVGGVRMVFPLRDWSDEELWEYIKENHVPVQEARYNGDAHWHANDWTHACTACIDPRTSYETTWCPKLKREVPNRGAEVLQLQEKPYYIEMENA